MKTIHKVLLLAAGMLVFVGAGALTYTLEFLMDGGELQDKLSQYDNAITGFREVLDEESTVDQRLRDIAQGSLGFNAEQVDASFREGLQNLAVDAGLIVDEIVVTTQPARAVKNPAVEAKVREFFQSARYSKADFVLQADLLMADAEVRGSGTFPAVTRLIALAQSQPWIWAVRGFSLKPRDAQATTFDIRLDVSTGFMPDLLAARAPEDQQDRTQRPPIRDPTAEQVVAATSIVSRNVFAPPPPPVQEIVVTRGEPAPVPAPGDPGSIPGPPAPPLPYHEWRLTAVSETPVQGALAWMLNIRTGSAVLLSPGQGVLDAKLLRIGGEEAVFQIGEQRYSLALYETLADRHPVE